eukprot:1097853-Rhodomonas_salina.3
MCSLETERKLTEAAKNRPKVSWGLSTALEVPPYYHAQLVVPQDLDGPIPCIPTTGEPAKERCTVWTWGE